MSHLHSNTLVLLLVLGLAACGGEEEAEAETETEETSEAAAGGDSEGQEAAPAEPADDGPCPSATALTIGGIDRSPHLDGVSGSFTPTTAFADVTLGRSADLVFASYTIEADPQFGLSAPTGNPSAPDGGLIFQISITGDSENLGNGMYAEEDGEAGRVSTTSMYRGSNRIIPLADHTVRITEIAEDHVCGEIIPEEGASWPAVSGQFRVDAV